MKSVAGAAKTKFNRRMGGTRDEEAAVLGRVNAAASLATSAFGQEWPQTNSINAFGPGGGATLLANPGGLNAGRSANRSL